MAAYIGLPRPCEPSPFQVLCQFEMPISDNGSGKKVPGATITFFQISAGLMPTQTMCRWLSRHWPVLLVVAWPLLVLYFIKAGTAYREDCWSPNREYFMVMRQSWISKVFYSSDRKEGWILVYDKYGNFHHRYDGSLNPHGGPYWLGNEILINTDPGALLELPTDAGDGGLRFACY